MNASDPSRRKTSGARRIARYGLGAAFVVAGGLHFAAPEFYVDIMPPYLPLPRTLVYASGAAEMAGGAGLFFPPPVRRWAGGGLILLLVAVFPANVHMVHEAVAAGGWRAPWTLATLGRLPFQFALVAAVWWVAFDRPENAATEPQGRY